jgi:hypothetical protein
MVLLYHTTPLRNVRSISKIGLDLRYCKTAKRVIWLATAQRTLTIGSHVATRHDCYIDRLCVIPVCVPRRWIKKHGKGLWTCDQDIPLYYLGKVIPYLRLP